MTTTCEHPNPNPIPPDQQPQGENAGKGNNQQEPKLKATVVESVILQQSVLPKKQDVEALLLRDDPTCVTPIRSPTKVECIRFKDLLM